MIGRTINPTAIMAFSAAMVAIGLAVNVRWFAWIFVVVMFSAALLVWLDRSMTRDAERIAREFREAFPDRCMLCSFQRQRDGGVRTDPHPCPEGNGVGDLPEARAL